MAIRLPPNHLYNNRKECIVAGKTASIVAFGRDCRVDSSHSGKKKVVVLCKSAIMTVTSTNSSGKLIRGKTHWIAEDLQGFVCTQQEGEKQRAFTIRRREELAVFAAATSTICPFRLEAMATADGKWYFKILDNLGNGLNYVPHSESCTCMAKVTGNVLVELMQPAIAANTNMTGEQAWGALVARNGISKGMLPAKSSLYRAKLCIQHESDKWYPEDWARMEPFLIRFQEMNPMCRVVLEKTDDNRFLR